MNKVPNFTYHVNTDAFIKDLISFFELKGITSNDSKYTNVAKFLSESTCSIRITGSYASKTDFHKAYLTVFLPIEPMKELDGVVGLKSFQSTVQHWINDILDHKTGLTIVSTTLKLPLTHSIDNASSLKIPTKVKSDIEIPKRDFLPSNLFDTGKNMSEAYLIMFLLENSLRYFIEEVSKNHYGDSFYSSLSISKTIIGNIAGRKKKETKNKWLSPRGSSDIFYMDFKDLSNLIMNNWNLFEEFFPDLAFITGKISDLVNIRNIIAHNAFLAEREFNILVSYYNMIIHQLET